MSNEAAERLRSRFWEDDEDSLLDEALAAERRATVERIRARVEAGPPGWDWRDLGAVSKDWVVAILDEEAAR